MGEREWREGKILKIGGDKSSTLPNKMGEGMERGRNLQIRRGQILHILKYKSWMGGQGGEGDGGRGREVANIRHIRDESQNNNATKVDISCPNVKLPCKLRSLNLDFVPPTSKWIRLIISVALRK